MESQFLHHLDKLKKRLHNHRITIAGIYDSLIDRIQFFDQQSDSISDEDFQTELCRIYEEITKLEPLKKVCLAHRESYSHISRLGKEIEKNFTNDLEELHAHQAEPLDSDTLDSVIADYLISQQLYEQANLICPKDNIQTEKIEKIYESIRLLEAGEIDNAIKCVENIEGTSKNIMFYIHKLNFIKILKSENLPGALNYAKEHIQQFADTNLEEIKHLMCACLFANSGKDSPYSDLFKESYTKETIKEILME